MNLAPQASKLRNFFTNACLTMEKNSTFRRPIGTVVPRTGSMEQDFKTPQIEEEGANGSL